MTDRTQPQNGAHPSSLESGDFHTVPGFDAAGIAAGIKSRGGLDLALIASRLPCRAAALFTQNRFPAAPVQHGRRLLDFNSEAVYGVVVNSGCANACTGAPGAAAARLTAEAVEKALGAFDNSVFVMSTGVIGVQLPVDRLLAAVPRAVDALHPAGWTEAAQAIMTTDTRPKLASRRFEIAGVPVTLTGIAKGAGMIHPNMATMLSVIATDALVAQPLLQAALRAAADASFNRISIDGDTSTNDTVLLLANGLAPHAELADAAEPGYLAFSAALTSLCAELAQAVVRDGEGATKFVTVRVEGAPDDAAAHQAANTIATSPLVKTAFFGGDANWGRILAAAGRSGIELDPDRCDLFISALSAAGQPLPELQLVAGGTPLDYAEQDAAALFAQPEIAVRLSLGVGPGAATVWTTDLSHDYVSINGDYRT